MRNLILFVFFLTGCQSMDTCNLNALEKDLLCRALPEPWYWCVPRANAFTSQVSDCKRNGKLEDVKICGIQIMGNAGLTGKQNHAIVKCQMQDGTNRTYFNRSLESICGE